MPLSSNSRTRARRSLKVIAPEKHLEVKAHTQPLGGSSTPRLRLVAQPRGLRVVDLMDIPVGICVDRRLAHVPGGRGSLARVPCLMAGDPNSRARG